MITVRFIYIVIFVFTYAQAHNQNSSPYALFGHTSNIKYNPLSTRHLCVKNPDTTEVIKVLAFDFSHQSVFLFGKEDCVLEHQVIYPQEILKFLSTDPLFAQYPHNSPYAFSENRVVDAVDLEGLEAAISNLSIQQEGSIYKVTGSMTIKIKVLNLSSIDSYQFMDSPALRKAANQIKVHLESQTGIIKGNNKKKRTRSVLL